MRITDMITQDEFAWYFINFSPLLLWEMNRRNKWEFKFWSWGLKGYKTVFLLPLSVFQLQPHLHFHLIQQAGLPSINKKWLLHNKIMLIWIKKLQIPWDAYLKHLKCSMQFIGPTNRFQQNLYKPNKRTTCNCTCAAMLITLVMTMMMRIIH